MITKTPRGRALPYSFECDDKPFIPELFLNRDSLTAEIAASSAGSFKFKLYALATGLLIVNCLLS